MEVCNVLLSLSYRYSNIFAFLISQHFYTQLSQTINSPSVPTAVGKCKISIEKNKKKNRKNIFVYFYLLIFYY